VVFTDVLKAYSIAISMDGRGPELDAYFVERLWRSVKHEGLYLRLRHHGGANVGADGILCVLQYVKGGISRSTTAPRMKSTGQRTAAEQASWTNKAPEKKLIRNK
jgi:hypothetical protein